MLAKQAFNLRNYGLATLNSSTESSSGSDACGDPSGGGTATMSRSTSHGSMKQEAATRAERDERFEAPVGSRWEYQDKPSRARLRGYRALLRLMAVFRNLVPADGRWVAITWDELSRWFESPSYDDYRYARDRLVRGGVVEFRVTKRNGRKCSEWRWLVLDPYTHDFRPFFLNFVVSETARRIAKGEWLLEMPRGHYEVAVAELEVFDIPFPEIEDRRKRVFNVPSFSGLTGLNGSVTDVSREVDGFDDLEDDDDFEDFVLGSEPCSSSFSVLTPNLSSHTATCNAPPGWAPADDSSPIDDSAGAHFFGRADGEDGDFDESLGDQAQSPDSFSFVTPHLPSHPSGEGAFSEPFFQPLSFAEAPDSTAAHNTCLRHTVLRDGGPPSTGSEALPGEPGEGEPPDFSRGVVDDSSCGGTGGTTERSVNESRVEGAGSGNPRGSVPWIVSQAEYCAMHPDRTEEKEYDPFDVPYLDDSKKFFDDVNVYMLKYLQEGVVKYAMDVYRETRDVPVDVVMEMLQKRVSHLVDFAACYLKRCDKYRGRVVFRFPDSYDVYTHQMFFEKRFYNLCADLLPPPDLGRRAAEAARAVLVGDYYGPDLERYCQVLRERLKPELREVRRLLFHCAQKATYRVRGEDEHGMVEAIVPYDATPSEMGIEG